jgi:hypothetical protein
MDQFGTSIAAADFTGDGYADLAVGVPREVVGNGKAGGGGVILLRGSAHGLTGKGALSYGPATGTSFGSVGYGALGRELVAGYFDGGFTPDLAILGYNGKDGPVDDVVFYLRGRAGHPEAPLVTAPSWTIDFQARDLPDMRLPDRALVAGDVNGDGIDELAVPTARATPAGYDDDDEGAVVFVTGTPTGPAVNRIKIITKATPGVPGAPTPHDGWNISAALGDLNGDGYADLAVGLPAQSDLYGDGGAVLLLFGSAGGITVTHAEQLNQDSPGVPGVVEREDSFGWGVSITDRTGDGIGDLAVGSPGEYAGTRSVGTITTFTGRRGVGFSTAGSVARTPAQFGFSYEDYAEGFGETLP